MSDYTYLNANQETEPKRVKKSGSKAKFNPAKHLTAITGVEVYNSTVVARRASKSQTGGGKRKEILNLSSDSLARLAFVAFNTPAVFPSMMTLTFADIITNGEKVKRCLNSFLTNYYRQQYPGALYLWWLEFQKRGAPHFHVLSTVDLAALGKLATIHRDNGETWQTHWDTWQMLETTWKRTGGGLTAWEVVNDPEGGKKYAAKYATKAYQKAVPPEYRNVGRFWGHSRQGVKPEPNGTYACTEEQLREALKRGGWEHLPDDGEIIYRELFQAAQLIDLSQLNPASRLPISYPKRERQPGVYLCLACGGWQTTKWVGQCEACGTWNSLSLRSPKETN